MKKQFGIAMIALSAAMAFTFTACNDDSSSAKGPEKVSKVEDLSEECEDGEEYLVGDKEVLYTCTDGKWATEAKSSASKPKSSSSKVEEEDECDPDLENCDDDDDENNEEEVKSSSSKKKPSSASSEGSGSDSGEGGSGSEEEGGETETPCTEDTETQTCIGGKLVDNTNVGECCTAAGKCTLEKDIIKFDKTTHFCTNRKTVEPLCNGKTYTPATGGECGKDGNYYYSKTDGSFVEDLRNQKTYKYVNIDDVIWMAENLNYTEGLIENKNYYKNSGYEGIAYTWAAAMGSTEEECGYGKNCELSEGVQGICPNGWHLPTMAEWKNLFDNNSADDLLSPNWYSKDSEKYASVTGKSGFNAIPAFSIYDDLKFDMPMFWTSTESDGYPTHYAYIAVFFLYGGNNYYTELDDREKDANNVVSGFAAQIRCIKNAAK